MLQALNVVTSIFAQKILIFKRVTQFFQPSLKSSQGEEIVQNPGL